MWLSLQVTDPGRQSLSLYVAVLLLQLLPLLVAVSSRCRHRPLLPVAVESLLVAVVTDRCIPWSLLQLIAVIVGLYLVTVTVLRVHCRQSLQVTVDGWGHRNSKHYFICRIYNTKLPASVIHIVWMMFVGTQTFKSSIHLI